ncbi:MAG: hypothetical protein PWP15_32 [Methanothermococcus sp.]|uniref:hypothetical protein n=1 Tax=Methanothermococcus TaxID=155862 RepID=UPI0003765A17|nr:MULTISPECIES: hypothetical protein [Methanothermococcus]MDK2789525.1 hypothetical protein [Methanothermococcus sp.]MDK2987432.1 hypothetical protein [Methanothermococcus sp.]
MEIYILFAVVVLLFLIIYIIVKIQKFKKISKTANILYNAKMNRKLNLKSNRKIIYFALIFNLIILIRNIMEYYHGSEVVLSVVLNFGAVVILVFSILVLEHAVNKKKFIEVQISDKGILSNKKLVWCWNNFKGYLKKGEYVVLRPKYIAWVVGDIYLLNEGELENIIKNYLKEMD